MKIKNVEELANVLSMAFRTYSATVATGRNIEPFLPLIDGQDGVTVFVMLNNQGEISIRAPAVEPIAIKTVTAEPLIVVESLVTEDETAEEMIEAVKAAETHLFPEEEVIEEKPKRKRRS